MKACSIKISSLLVFICICTFFLVSGCTVKGEKSITYNKPSYQKVDNTMIVDKNVSNTWDTIVENLSKSFYVINNISKDSRIINVSFSTSSPEKYIDCGSTRRMYKRGSDKKYYKYDSAKNSCFMVPVGRQGAFEFNDESCRETDLEGRINIFIAPVKNDKTKVTVNARYIFNVDSRYARYKKHVAWNHKGNIIDSGRRNNSLTYNFSTNEKKIKELRDGSHYLCVSKGVLERSILNMAKSK